MLNDIFKEKKETTQKIKKEIVIDYREKNSLVPSYLIKKELKIQFKKLEVGDYLLKDTIIERKEITDLAQSILNKRIFKQLEEMKQYPKQILIIEGNLTKFSLHPNALRGFLLSSSIKYKIPTILSRNEEETALYLKLISEKEEKEFSLKPNKKNLTKNERLQYILESFPNIGPKKSKKLLEKFTSLKKIFNSKIEELEKTIGKDSVQFKEIINYKYIK